MRLAEVATKRSVVASLKLRAMRLVSRADPPDVIKTLVHRPAFFGTAFLALVQRLLRGPSEWTVGEREIVATWVSRRNTCPFCAKSHAAVAEAALGATLTLEDLDAAPMSDRLRATLAFLESPDRARADDARAAGATTSMLDEAIHIAFAFDVINRVANTLDFEVPSAAQNRAAAKMLLRVGYRV